ncbi:LbetaH domain-containing protein [Thermocoleostomius sinensis]|uniref:Transferase n=1 Tax=Thermocoleostomius sinensis A174 TaxID=2016057 RepID=A0A9E9CBF8_9CYAN|nr:hypothetical protein [Thermocoleostomius sinensis]WAL62297.1 hypothetical protein OXH18_09995 [Thermocoleostomius sinensis A174]
MSSLIRSSSPAVIRDAHFCISGSVTIDPSAAIAPNVLLQADPGSKLIVAANVCVGMGCVLHAYQGTLELEAGVTLGSGVLIIGHGRIGVNACVGPMSTIINSSVLPHQMVPPGSLIGDGSRQVIEVESSPPIATESIPSPPSPTPSVSSAQSSSTVSSPTSINEPPSPNSSPIATSNQSRVVYGKAYIERMMVTMFPHRQSSPTDEKKGED